MERQTKLFTRRQFLRSAATAGLLAAGVESLVPAYAWQGGGASTARRIGEGEDIIDLVIRRKTIVIGDRRATAVTMNGSVPGPLLRLREGETVIIRVTNQLEEHTSIHWHGILVPANMDGVPGVSFPGIKPGETFTYRYEVKQSGTYWYHSHSGLQEQLGHYGPLIIDPAKPESYPYDRDYVVMLSDWTFEDPYKVMAKLKKRSGYYNFQRRTVPDFFRDVAAQGWWETVSDRAMWGRMRMDPTDIADVTGYTYTYLVNGLPPEANWTALFRGGERVRLRFINGSASTYFNIRIPGLKFNVVQADGQDVQPVSVDEFQIAVAETYDVIVEPKAENAYTIFAEAMDRSGYTCGTLAPREGMSAPVPALRARPLRTMADMGMADMAHGTMSPAAAGQETGMKHDMSGMDMPPGAPESGMKHDMPGMSMPSGPMSEAPAQMAAGVMHGPDTHGPGNSMVAMMSRSRLNEPGTGLENTGTRVLVYTDLRSLTPGDDQRKAEREIELHLTGNMERFMWSFDGKKFSEAEEPIPFNYGERVRVTLVNDTMMEHPIHLHGMFMELDNGAGRNKPRKHTINVKGGSDSLST
jgi:CopA family copper-resistance protein